MQIDPWQQHNIAGQSGLPQHVQDELGSSPAILGRCSGYVVHLHFAYAAAVI